MIQTLMLSITPQDNEFFASAFDTAVITSSKLIVSHGINEGDLKEELPKKNFFGICAHLGKDNWKLATLTPCKTFLGASSEYLAIFQREVEKN